MNQTLTLVCKLSPTHEQRLLLEDSTRAYIGLINALVDEMVVAKASTRKTTKDVVAALPSAVKNQAIRDAKSVFKKAKKVKFSRVPLLKKPQIIWNNQNFTLKDQVLSMPFIVGGKSTRVTFELALTERETALLATSKLGSLRVTPKNGKWMAQMSLTVEVTPTANTQSMGIDLGILVPAVAKTSAGNVKFFGKGRQNKYLRRKYQTRRRKLGKLKKWSALKKMNNKEQRLMNNLDHQVSRQIVNEALKQNVKIIKLESLEGIRNTTKTSRKHRKNLHTWSFYRLAGYITYKARLAGLEVCVVDPRYTSQTCPNCGERHKAKGRTYVCGDCGFRTHRDLVGATNILNAPVLSGHSLAA